MDWTGLRTERTARWYRQLHIFTHPFYCIEYGLAQVAALQPWGMSVSESDRAMTRYKRALALGGTASLPEIWCTAGASLAFDEATLAPLVARVVAVIDDLG